MLTLSVVLLTGCGKEKEEININEFKESLLNNVTYSAELSKVGKNADLYFPDLPEGTTVELYTAGGYFADELACFTVVDQSETETVEEVVQNHVDELREQFLDYVPEEVDKIEKAVIKQNGKYLFLCITDDYKDANTILSNRVKIVESTTEVVIEKGQLDIGITPKKTLLSVIIQIPY